MPPQTVALDAILRHKPRTHLRQHGVARRCLLSKPLRLSQVAALSANKKASSSARPWCRMHGGGGGSKEENARWGNAFKKDTDANRGNADANRGNAHAGAGGDGRDGAMAQFARKQFAPTRPHACEFAHPRLCARVMDTEMDNK